jgi:hypothetical protein
LAQPRCVHYQARSFRLETFKDFCVESGSRTPELYSQNYIPLSPDWFDYCFIYESLLLVEGFELHPSNQYILVMVIPSYFYLAKMCLFHGKSPVKV